MTFIVLRIYTFINVYILTECLALTCMEIINQVTVCTLDFEVFNHKRLTLPPGISSCRNCSSSPLGTVKFRLWNTGRSRLFCNRHTQTRHGQSDRILDGSSQWNFTSTDTEVPSLGTTSPIHFGLPRPSSDRVPTENAHCTSEPWDPEPAESIWPESCMGVAGASPSTSCSLTGRSKSAGQSVRYCSACAAPCRNKSIECVTTHQCILPSGRRRCMTDGHRCPAAP